MLTNDKASYFLKATPLSGQIGTDSVMTMKIKISVQEPEKAGVDWIRYCEK